VSEVGASGGAISQAGNLNYTQKYQNAYVADATYVAPKPQICTKDLFGGNFVDHGTASAQFTFQEVEINKKEDPEEIIKSFKAFTENSSGKDKIPYSKVRELEKLMDETLANPTARANLIKHFGLDSEAAKKAITVVISREAGYSGFNGVRKDHVYAIAAEMLNRAISHNIIKEITANGKFTPTKFEDFAVKNYKYSASGGGYDAGAVDNYNKNSDFLVNNKVIVNEVLSGKFMFDRQVTTNGKKTTVATDGSKIFFHQAGNHTDILYREERDHGKTHCFAKTYGPKKGIYCLGSVTGGINSIVNWNK
jgi:hypothetical protein